MWADSFRPEADVFWKSAVEDDVVVVVEFVAEFAPPSSFSWAAVAKIKKWKGRGKGKDLPKRGLIPVAVEPKVPRGQFLLLNHKSVVEVQLVLPLFDGAPFHHAIEARNNREC